jgi:hypothetical protein
VLERLQITSGLLPLGCIRLGDSRHRAILFKLAADRLAIPCCLLRGAIPDVDSSEGFLDLSLCTPDLSTYHALHHWNLVRLEAGRCYMVDCVGLPSDVRPVDNRCVCVSPGLS